VVNHWKLMYDQVMVSSSTGLRLLVWTVLVLEQVVLALLIVLVLALVLGLALASP
jgi:hypothetical protein